MTIFLAGAHGVGKSYLAERTAKRLPVQHVTASQLIREERGRSTWTSDRRVNDASGNQDALIAAVRRRVDGSPRLLLDGHFVLRDSQGRLVRLDVDVFARLKIVATILIEAPHEIVATRLANRGGRIEELSAIEALAVAEREHATLVCSALDLPLISLQAPTEEQFAIAIEGILRQVS
ncbi:MAG: AAA family ATPase [Burkholderiales bacterium]|nr:AAA family ATPase [Burkholderiales bacterium]